MVICQLVRCDMEQIWPDSHSNVNNDPYRSKKE